ncbi:MAG: hypothetical protein L0Y57_02475, partial [Beijerinckiaceae bacterium]|nr:hypothetical protein [Beijerinckiaceae bacterium]
MLDVVGILKTIFLDITEILTDHVSAFAAIYTITIILLLLFVSLNCFNWRSKGKQRLHAITDQRGKTRDQSAQQSLAAREGTSLALAQELPNGEQTLLFRIHR